MRQAAPLPALLPIAWSLQPAAAMASVVAACRAAPVRRGTRQPTVRCSSAAPAAAVGARDRTTLGKSGERPGAGGGEPPTPPPLPPPRLKGPAPPGQASPCAGLEVSSLGIGAWSWGDRSRYWQNDLDKDSNLTVRLC